MTPYPIVITSTVGSSLDRQGKSSGLWSSQAYVNGVTVDKRLIVCGQGCGDEVKVLRRAVALVTVSTSAVESLRTFEKDTPITIRGIRGFCPKKACVNGVKAANC